MPDPSQAQVLVVDDDECVRQLISTVLEDAGYHVLGAQDGIEALAILRASPCRLVVLLDWMMPRMSGEEVLQAVKDCHGPLSRHAFVVVTAKGSLHSAHAQNLLRELSVSVMQKPFRLQLLLDLVEEQTHQVNGGT
jgi:CheY-like chemotaxis protein